MARQESDREDILRDATGLVDRVEFRCSWSLDSIFCGFRRQGAMSLFIGQDEVYQFDSCQALRRAYYRGKLLKARDGRLIELTRQRSKDATYLLRRDLTDDQQQEHLRRLELRLDQLASSFCTEDFERVGDVAASGRSALPRLLQWLQSCPRPPAVADVPYVR
jgi:hypothetical protein